jgi:type II secretory pathway pseudopilin PulG
MITGITVIVILVALILPFNGLVARKGARARAESEIQAMSSACEAYKTDNGDYPQDTKPNSATSALDPRTSFTPSNYVQACGVVYSTLSGVTNIGGVMKQTGTNYAPDFFKSARLASGPNSSTPGLARYILDPWGNSYGYSTAGLELHQEYQAALATNPQAVMRLQNIYGAIGYNVTFDLWSTGGTTGTNGTSDTAKWIKNW